MYKTIISSSILLGSYFIYKSYKYNKVLDSLEELFMEEVD